MLKILPVCPMRECKPQMLAKAASQNVPVCKLGEDRAFLIATPYSPNFGE